MILASVKQKEDGSYSDDGLIRNHQDGEWRQISCSPRRSISEQAIKAVETLGLDFGAVDLILHNDTPYVLEVNTAPGLQVDNRLEAYVRAFKEEARKRLD